MVPSPAGARPLLLVIDDDERSARLLGRLLTEDGYTVEVACDGQQAITRLGLAPAPDAIVTDFRMPHADGLVVARFARGRSPAIPVLVVTGYPDLVETQGFDPALMVFTKPLSYSELTDALRRPPAPAAPPVA